MRVSEGFGGGEPWVCKFPSCYHPRMRVGNDLSCVCLSVGWSVCLSVEAITFEPLHIGTLCLAWRYILTIFRSSLNIKVIGSRSRPCAKNDYLLISTCYSFECDNRSLIRSHIKVKVKLRSLLRRGNLMRVVCIWIKCINCLRILIGQCGGWVIWWAEACICNRVGNFHTVWWNGDILRQ